MVYAILEAYLLNITDELNFYGYLVETEFCDWWIQWHSHYNMPKLGKVITKMFEKEEFCSAKIQEAGRAV